MDGVKTYDKILHNVYSYIREHPRTSAYDIAKGITSDPRTVQSMTNILESLDKVEVNIIEQKDSRKSDTYYSIKEEKMKSSTTTLVSEQLDKIMGQTDGYRLGELWRHTDKSLGGVMPIILDNDTEREYVMMEETKDTLTLTDSGRIDLIKATSKVNKPVFVRMGTAFKGSTQERAADVSVIIMPDKEQEITVKCIHASKGIKTGAQFSYAGSVPHFVERGFAMSAGQSETWGRVSQHNERCCERSQFSENRQMNNSPSFVSRLTGRSNMSAMSFTQYDDLIGTREKLKEYNKDSTEILKKIPSVEGQVGCIIFDQKGVFSLELYDHPLSWKAYHQSIYEKYEDILLDTQVEPLFSLNKESLPKLIQAFISDIKSATTKEVKNTKDFKTCLFEKTVIGEYTELNGKLIHLLGIRKEDEKEPRKNIVSDRSFDLYSTQEPTVTRRTYTTTPYRSYKINGKSL